MVDDVAARLGNMEQAGAGTAAFEQELAQLKQTHGELFAVRERTEAHLEGEGLCTIDLLSN